MNPQDVPGDRAPRPAKGVFRPARAFSLIELLVVMAIMGLLVTLSMPSLSSMSRSGQMNQSVYELAGLFEQARQYAISQNTYVWVAMSANNSASGQTVGAVILASNTGVDPSPWSNYGSVPNSQISVVGKPQTFSQLAMQNAGTFTGNTISSLPATPAVTSGNSPSSNTAVFNVNVPGQGTQAFNRVVQFTPGGEARITSSVIDVIEFDLQPVHGSTLDNNNVAVMRVNGLTGQTSVYRP